MIGLIIPTGLVFACSFTTHKHVFIVIFKTRPHYFKGTVSIHLVNTKISIWDNLSVDTLLIYYVIDSVSVLNRGTAPITRIRLGLILKFSLILPVPMMGMDMFSRFVSRFSSVDCDANELGSI